VSFPYYFCVFLLKSNIRVIHVFDRVLLATIRDQGSCPCPRCLIPKSKLDQLGLITDSKNRIDKARNYDVNRVNKARIAIYKLGKPIGGVHVERLLKATSTVPTAVSLKYTIELINNDHYYIPERVYGETWTQI
jgi:hypothetical protein